MGPTYTQKLFQAKETINKMKRQPMIGRKYLQMTHMVLVSKIYMQLLIFNRIKTNKPINK